MVLQFMIKHISSFLSHNSYRLYACVDSIMTDVHTVTIGLSVSVCLWKITDFISESNYLPVWVKTSILWERLQLAVVMLPL